MVKDIELTVKPVKPVKTAKNLFKNEKDKRKDFQVTSDKKEAGAMKGKFYTSASKKNPSKKKLWLTKEAYLESCKFKKNNGFIGINYY